MTYYKKLVRLPSWTRQIEHEMAERAKWDEKADKERKEHGFNVFRLTRYSYETIL